MWPLFRAYENGKPVESKNYLKWNSMGAQNGELVFVSGNPGSTDRLSTMKQIEVERDVVLPETLKLIKRRLAVLKRYAAGGEEQARQATSQMRSLENSLKAYLGEYDGLLDKSADFQKAEGRIGFSRRCRSQAGIGEQVWKGLG